MQFQPCCISFDSYIKPQLTYTTRLNLHSCISFDSYIKPQRVTRITIKLKVVYLLIPTSNHNIFMSLSSVKLLYIFWFLHQTTTPPLAASSSTSCISFDSYIKPQPSEHITNIKDVVYLLIPTSNHNPYIFCLFDIVLYIFWFLHQTTTILFYLLNF